MALYPALFNPRAMAYAAPQNKPIQPFD